MIGEQPDPRLTPETRDTDRRNGMSERMVTVPHRTLEFLVGDVPHHISDWEQAATEARAALAAPAEDVAALNLDERADRLSLLAEVGRLRAAAPALPEPAQDREAQVEALAAVLYGAYGGFTPWEQVIGEERGARLNEARAALDWVEANRTWA